MPISWLSGPEDERLIVSITLTPHETERISHDAKISAELIDSFLWALGLLRTGINSRDPGQPAPVRGDWITIISHLARLHWRVDGALAGTIRAYAAAGGDIEKLAEALHVDTSEARQRLAKVIDEPPEDSEQWATARAPIDHTRRNRGDG